MTDDEIKRALTGLYEALRATNVALDATVRVQEEHGHRLSELEGWEYRNDERITSLEVAKFRHEAPFLPPPEKLN